MKLLYFLLLISFSALAQDIEALSWKEGRLNNRLDLSLTKKEYDKLYKQPDSIMAPNAGETCTTGDVKMLYHKGAKYELVNDMLSFRSIDFRKNSHTFLSFKNDWFDHTTTLKSFKKTYPGASEFMEDFITDDGDVFDMISLLPKGEPDNFEWLFYFNDGKLVIIECLFTCD